MKTKIYLFLLLAVTCSMAENLTVNLKEPYSKCSYTHCSEWVCIAKDKHGYRFVGSSTSKSWAIDRAKNKCLAHSYCSSSCQVTTCYLD